MRTAPLAIAVALVFAAACGGGGDGEPPSQTRAPAARVTPGATATGAAPDGASTPGSGVTQEPGSSGQPSPGAGNATRPAATQPVPGGPTPVPGVTQPPPGTTITFTGNVLVTSNREYLDMCADGADGLEVTVDQVERAADAIDVAVGRLDPSDPAFLYLGESQLIVDCPGAAVPLGARVPSREAAGQYAAAVSVPNGYRLFIYFLPPNTYAATFGSAPFFTAAAEVCCGANVREVTTAVYVPQLATTDTLAAAILSALGL